MLLFLEIKQNHRPLSMFLTKMQSSTNHLIWIAPAQHLAKLKIKQAVTTPHEAAVHCTKTVVRANLATAADAHLTSAASSEVHIQAEPPRQASILAASSTLSGRSFAAVSASRTFTRSFATYTYGKTEVSHVVQSQ